MGRIQRPGLFFNWSDTMGLSILIFKLYTVYSQSNNYKFIAGIIQL